MRALRALMPLAILALAACGGSQTSAPKTGGGTAPTGTPTIATNMPPTPGTPAPPTPRADTSLIHRDVLFGNPDKTTVRVSPDGKLLAFLAPVDGVMNVMVAPIDHVDQAKAVTHEKTRPLRRYWWAQTSDKILYAQDNGGDENFHVWVVDANGTGDAKDLTPIQGVAAQIQDASKKIPGEILVGLNDRDPKAHDLWRIDIKTGAKKLVAQNDGGFQGFVTDDDYVARLAFRAVPADGSMEVLAKGPKGAWDQTYMTIPYADALSTVPIGFDASGKTLYVTDTRDRDTAGLFEVDFATKHAKLLADDPKADVGGVTADPITERVQAVQVDYDKMRWMVIDKAVQPDFDYLATVVPGAELAITNRSNDDKTWIVAYAASDGPTRYYKYDRAKKHADFLFVHQAALEGLPLAKMTSAVIPSRDGMSLVSYLTLPKGSDDDGDGKPSHALPMVLFVHGGPWARDTWGFNRYHQWLANRGYAVLSVNFRGSTGFGKKFTNAGDKEWGAKMHDDLLDAVDWAKKNGVAQPDKIAIMGGSYGGYATLAGLSFTPDVFACGVDIVGPSNLVTLLNTIPPYWQPEIEQMTRRMGDHRTEEGRKFLMDRSPLTHAGAIKKPLLIGQGANDPRVKQAESDQIVKALEGKSVPVTYVVFPDEGHGFARPVNNTAFSAVTETFLAQWLGGSYEPVGDDFKGSSITVPAGADQVFGLADALRDVHRADQGNSR